MPIQEGHTCAAVAQLCITTVAKLLEVQKQGTLNPLTAVFTQETCGPKDTNVFPVVNIGKFVCCKKVLPRGAQSFDEPAGRNAHNSQIDAIVMDAANGLFGLFSLRPEGLCFEDNKELNAGVLLINLK